MDTASYLQLLRGNLVAEKCDVRIDQVGPLQAVVGYEQKFLPQMLAKLHMFTVAGAASEITGYAVDDFARHVAQYSKNRSGALLGLQSGVVAFPVLVSDRVMPDAVERAQRTPKLEFAVRVQPVVVDLSAGVVHTFRGRAIWGFAMNGHVRRRLARFVPDPAAAS